MRQPVEDLRGLHHALLNHIAVVSTYAHLLEDSVLDPDQRDLVKELLVSADAAHALATRLGSALGLQFDSKESAPDRT